MNNLTAIDLKIDVKSNLINFPWKKINEYYIF